jgi:glycosyltransferase involved in cell wall biosynthesis
MEALVIPNDFVHNASLGSVTIVIPIHNERGNIRKVLDDWAFTPFKIIVVDDGSTDEPEEVLNTYFNIEVIKNDKNRGYGWSLKRGIRRATTKWVLIMDGDGQYEVRDACRLINFMDDYPEEERPDMGVCDRRVKEKLLRFLGRKVLNTIASILCHRWIPDLNSGCRIFRRDLTLNYEPLISNSYSFTTTTMMMFQIDGYKVEWLPSKVVPRVYGKSKVRLVSHGLLTLKQILWIGIGLRTRYIRKVFRKWQKKDS